jgi:aarF domain-containing kinase
MSLFSAAKAAYEKLDKLEAQCPGSTAAAREALHSKYAAKALDLARSQGGVYVKAAQFIASLQGGSGGGGVPAAYISTLAALTDRAAPHELHLLAPLIEEELQTKHWVGETADGATPVFARIETPAVAAASLSQVHRAQMADGKWVALKLQFPWLAKQVRRGAAAAAAPAAAGPQLPPCPAAVWGGLTRRR